MYFRQWNSNIFKVVLDTYRTPLSENIISTGKCTNWFIEVERVRELRLSIHSPLRYTDKVEIKKKLHKQKSPRREIYEPTHLRRK